MNKISCTNCPLYMYMHCDLWVIVHAHGISTPYKLWCYSKLFEVVFHIEGKENQGCNLLEMFPLDVFTAYVKLEVGLNV